MTLVRKTELAFGSNLFCAIMVVLCVASFFTTGGAGNMQVAGVTCFRYFTVDSNILAGISCAVMAWYQAKSLHAGEYLVPRWALVLKYVGTAAVTLTLLVVLGFLGPLMGYGLMFTGSSLFLHGIVPVLCILTLELLEPGKLVAKDTWFAMIPLAIYAVFYLTFVVFIGAENGGWPDFYALNTTGMWYVSLAAMVTVMVLIAVTERLPHRKG